MAVVCEFCGMELDGYAEKHTLLDCAHHLKRELAALKGRRCKTCDNLDAYRDGSGNGRCHVRYRWSVMADMSCNRWAERGTE